MTQNIVKALAEYSGGFFLRDQTSWTCIRESDSVNVLRHPVEVWFQGGKLTADSAAEIVSILKQVPKVTGIRFLGTEVTDAVRDQLRKACPTASIERATVHDHTESEELAARYKERRVEFEKRFNTYTSVPGSEATEQSPSRRYELTTTAYTAGPSTWGFSRGIVVDPTTGETIADIHRNYGAFWHAWVMHPNGNEYLLCGEDYQGQTIVNLSQREVHTHFPEVGYNGSGFCWAQVFPSPDGLVLAVDGCNWACPYDLVFFDFRNPDVLPYPELGRTTDIVDSKGWKDNATFVLTRDIAIRKADGIPFDSLPEEEQDRLESDDSLLDYRAVELEILRPVLEAVDGSELSDMTP
ncbi:MAG: hypothetical protein JW818_10380 [Pirellulales bacterium]|nr:hypothetical protein [Pirellulales bacterium]